MLERVIRDSFKGITVVEEDVGYVNKLLSKQIAISARASGLRVCFVTLAEEPAPLIREKASVRSAVGGIEEVTGTTDVHTGLRPESAVVMLSGLDYDLIVIGSFSEYFVDKTEREAIMLMREIEALSKRGKSFVVTYEPGILSDKASAFLRSISTNVIVVRTQLAADRVERMLYVPKASSPDPLDRMIKITVDGSGVQEDTREFVG